MPGVRTNGIETYYEEYGTGPPIVFLHGGTMDLACEPSRPSHSPTSTGSSSTISGGTAGPVVPNGESILSNCLPRTFVPSPKR